MQSLNVNHALSVPPRTMKNKHYIYLLYGGYTRSSPIVPQYFQEAVSAAVVFFRDAEEDGRVFKCVDVFGFSKQEVAGLTPLSARSLIAVSISSFCFLHRSECFCGGITHHRLCVSECSDFFFFFFNQPHHPEQKDAETADVALERRPDSVSGFLEVFFFRLSH